MINMISVFGIIVNINCTRVKVEGRWYSVHWLTRQWCGNRRLWLSVYRCSQLIGWRRDGCSRPWFGIQNIWSSFPLAIGSSFVASNTLYATMASSFHNKLLLYTAWFSLVAVVARSEWFVRNPGMPAFWHSRATVPSRALWPTSFDENQQSAVGVFSGWK